MSTISSQGLRKTTHKLIYEAGVCCGTFTPYLSKLFRWKGPGSTSEYLHNVVSTIKLKNFNKS